MKRLCMTTGSFVLVVLSLICGVTRAAVIVNGDFSTPGTPPDPFVGWETDTALFDRPSDGGGFALFAVTGFSAQQLQQNFLVPGSAQTLSFEFLVSTAADGTAGGITPDNFQATLYDMAFNSLLPSPDPSFPGFFSVDNTGQEFQNAAVTVQDLGTGWKRVAVDLSSVLNQQVILDFSLLGDDDGLTTTVSLDNVDISLSGQAVVPEPGSLLIWMGTALAAAGSMARRCHFVGRVTRRTRSPNTIRRTP